VKLLDRAGWIEDPFVRDGADANLLPIEAAGEALGRVRPLGIEVPPTADPDSLVGLFNQVDLIAVRFPGHRDGRGFSIGRALRELGFTGRLRASGELIPDHFAFALACGFDEVEIDEARAARQPVEQWLAAAGVIGPTYQSVRDGRRSIFAARRAA